MRFLIPLLVLVILLCAFAFGPSVGKVVWLRFTAEKDIYAWKQEAALLGSKFPRTATNELRRLQLLRKLAQRGIELDGGIRDEAIEHNINPYTITVMILWQWEELLGI